MKIYIINGYGGSGKSSFENMVLSASKTKGHITSMVEIVKHFAEYVGWDGGKTDADRRMLSDLKDALTRWKDLPMIYVYNKIKEFEKLGDTYCFIDAREKLDIGRLKDMCEHNKWECKVILIDRGIEREYGNHADNNVMDCHYDTTITNYGDLSDLRKCAIAFVEQEDI